MPQDSPPPATKSSDRLLMGCLFVFGAAVLLSIGFAIYLARSRGAEPSKPVVRRAWVREQPPLLGHFHAPEIEDHAGVLCHHHADNTRSCWLRVIDGAKGAELWQVGPFSDEAANGIRFVSLGDRIVVAYGTGRVATYMAAHGEEIWRKETLKKFTDACPAPPPETAVWFESSEDKGTLVDAKAGTASTILRPAWCPRLPKGATYRPAARLISAEEVAPALAGEKDFTVDRVLSQDDKLVVLGHRLEGGREIATVIGLDPKDRTARWRRPLGAAAAHEPIGAADIAGDRLVVFYPEAAKAMFALIDLRTGDVQCARPLGDAGSLSPTAALSRERLAFYAGPPDGDSELVLRSTETCEELPPLR